MTDSLPPGCPIRTSAGLGVFAPRRGFSQLVTSFFASESLGIPHAPLVHSVLSSWNQVLPGMIVVSSFLPCGSPDAPYARCDLLCLRLLLCLLASSLCICRDRIASSLVNVLFPEYFRGCRHLPRKLFRRQCCPISRRIVPVVAALFGERVSCSPWQS